MFYNAKNESINIDNTAMDYIRFGTGKKNLIIIPGLGDALRTVKGTALPMALSYKMFAKDYTVYMFSRKNDLPTGYTSENMADDLLKAMDILNISKADIWGVSQGGTIAQYMAIKCPEKVNKLVLAVTYARLNETVNSCVSNWIDYAKENNYKAIFADTAEKSYTEKRLKLYRPFYGILAFLTKPETLDRFITCAEACLAHDAYDRLPEIKSPTLIIGGARDKIVGCEASYELHENIAGSELYIYNDYGHGLYEEAEDFNKRVLEYLNK